MVLEDLASDSVLDAAYAWLCHRRRRYPADADVWTFRARWPYEKARLQAELGQGRFQFSPQRRGTLRGGREVDRWSARDALVLKALALVLGPRLPVSPRCAHVKGHGGAKGAVREVLASLPAHRFVLRTDVSAYYASVDHDLLLDQLAEHVPDPTVLRLVGQYLRRVTERGGHFWTFRRGLSPGCPLSPLMGALFLGALDTQVRRPGLFYVRFMDDILVLAPTRAGLRAAVKRVNRLLAALQLTKHPAKTFVGRTARGFDFLGYHFSPAGLTVAQPTLERFVARATQLYEREADAPAGAVRLGQYVRRWCEWAEGGFARPPTRGGNGRRPTLDPSVDSIR